jgi:hypothetical protein
MAYTYGKRRNNPPTKVIGTRGFSLGINQLTHPTVIKNNELAEAVNAVYSQNGLLKKRMGSKVIATSRSGDTKINGLASVYGIETDGFIIRLGDSGIAQKYNQNTGAFTDIADSPTFPDKRTYIVQGYGKVYFMNEGLVLSSWDGTDWFTYTEVTDATTAPTVAKVGSGTGPRTYYYKYCWFNEIGYTQSSITGSIASMPETLDATTYITITVPTPPAGATEIGIFKGTTAGTEKFLDKMPVSQLVYHDKGQLAVDLNYPFPEINTTTGFKFKFATVFQDSLVGVTVEEGEDTIVFSGYGGAGNFAKFGFSRQSGDGGNESGYIAWRKGEGFKIRALQPFKEQLYVFKEDKVGVFDFSTSTGFAFVKDVNLALGAVSQDSVHVAGNDLRGWSREGAFSLGNEPNYADVIRSKLLSPRVQKTVDSITFADIDKISSVYYKNLSIWSLPTRVAGLGNNIMLVYDERYSAWSIWTGMKAAMFTKFLDKNNTEHLYYGDADSGEIVEMLSGYTDRNTPIVFRILTKDFDANLPYKYKTFGMVYFIFGTVSGKDTVVTILENGGKDKTDYSLTGNTVNQGWGIEEWGVSMWGESTSDEAAVSNKLEIKYIDMGSRDLFSAQVQVVNTGVKDLIEVMGVFFEYSESEQPLPSSKKLVKI